MRTYGQPIVVTLKCSSMPALGDEVESSEETEPEDYEDDDGTDDVETDAQAKDFDFSPKASPTTDSEDYWEIANVRGGAGKSSPGGLSDVDWFRETASARGLLAMLCWDDGKAPVAESVKLTGRMWHEAPVDSEGLDTEAASAEDTGFEVTKMQYAGMISGEPVVVENDCGCK